MLFHAVYFMSSYYIYTLLYATELLSVLPILQSASCSHILVLSWLLDCLSNVLPIILLSLDFVNYSTIFFT